jgi:molybdopterin molybdotransferase
MQEQCALDEATGKVTVQHAPRSGEWVRRRGEDIRAGSTILTRGTLLRAQELGLAASVGLATLPVYRRLKVGVFFTGDELAMPGEPLKPGAIYNSNRFSSLAAKSSILATYRTLAMRLARPYARPLPAMI